LVPALAGSFLLPTGLFIFGWTARPDIHWIVPLIGVVIFVIGTFLILQSIFVYVPLSYPKYAASLFAGNDLTRSAMAAGSILYARPLFINLGIGKGVSVLGGLSTLGIIGMIALYFTGAKLRARSKFAQS
jgi:DHA1 family multidrug resistance protein-like MFS transporter